MGRLGKACRTLIYAPLAPLSVRAASRFSRVMGWLPPQFRSSNTVRRILVVQPHNSLGDLVLSIPFLAEIHNLWPDAEIDVVVGHAMTEIFENIPFVNRVIAFIPSKLRPPYRRYQDAIRLARLAHRQLKGPYDVAIDPRWDSDVFAYMARLTCFFSGSAQRIGYSGTADRVDPSLDQFLTKTAAGGSHEHELIRKLRLLERVGLSNRHIEDREKLYARQVLRGVADGGRREGLRILQSAGLLRDEPYGVLAPSASATNRIWPIELLSELVQILSAETGLRFLAVGSAQDAGLCRRLAEMNSGLVISVAGQTGLVQLCSILSRASLFIGNDSGPAHISGMLGTNTVVVSAFSADLNEIDHTNAPSRFRPCGPRVRVVQPERPLPPCQGFCSVQRPHCIKQVSVAQVLTDCQLLLKQVADASNGEEVCSTER